MTPMDDIVQEIRDIAKTWGGSFLTDQRTAASFFNKAADEIERLRALSEWRDMADAPKDGTNLLLFCPREDGTRFQITGYWNSDDCLWWATSHDPIYPPSKWLPLPAPPQGDGG